MCGRSLTFRRQKSNWAMPFFFLKPIAGRSPKTLTLLSEGQRPSAHQRAEPEGSNGDSKSRASSLRADQVLVNGAQIVINRRYRLNVYFAFRHYLVKQ